MRRGTALLLALLVGGCASPVSLSATPSLLPSPSVSVEPSAATPEPSPEIRSIVVLLDLHDPGAWPAGTTSCAGTGGYDDIAEGMQLTVRDEENRVRGVGSLRGGNLLDPDICSFYAAIEDVGDAEFYVIETSRRGSLTYTFDEMEKAGWIVTLRIGA